MKFDVLVIDPPWNFSNPLANKNGIKRGAADHYSCMNIKNLCALPIKDLAKQDGCILALWCVGSMLQEALDVMKSYGFKQKQVYVWAKTKKEVKTINNCLSFGMGNLTRQCHEICLIGINNTKVYKKLQNRSQRSVCFAPNLKHSSKPEHLQDSLDLMFSGPDIKKLEIFARRQRPGWQAIGNELPGEYYGEDIIQSIDRLIKM